MDSKPSSSLQEVEVISKETIKPSVPTPVHLKTFKISLLDQISPPLYVPIILFYTANYNEQHKLDHENLCSSKSDLLKKSLSETLTHFYPLAGRTRDNIMIDCNDDGVDYIEARIKGNISEFMKPPEVVLLHQLLPYDISSSCSAGNDHKIQVGVQVNMFDCGGIAIGVCISHKIADASSMITFINSWVSIARTRTTTSINSPTFDSVHLYPLCEGIPMQSELSFTTPVEGEKVVTKRFVLDASQIRSKLIRAKFGDDDDDDDKENGLRNYPTRVQAVSGLIWKCIMAKPRSGSSSSSSKFSILNLPVNLRGRMNPPLDQWSFGNLLTLATTTASTASTSSTSTESSGSLEELVEQIRIALSNINSETIKYIQGEGGFIKLQELLGNVHEMFAKGEVYMFSSWCRFPVYEVDFGWGKPTWVSCSSQPYKNTVILMDTRNGDGIEAWVSLVDEDMALFQQNQELLEFVSFTD